mmetsp:Transcript_9072/g.13644  ORF Transcript_9072/g.13644 Transcript_9072/m.13644 type:complete len:260 (-) Transcript_9072:302-1081(-)
MKISQRDGPSSHIHDITLTDSRFLCGLLLRVLIVPSPAASSTPLVLTVVSPSTSSTSPAVIPTSSAAPSSAAIIVSLQSDGTEGVLIERPLLARCQAIFPSVPIQGRARESIEKVVLVVTSTHSATTLACFLRNFGEYFFFFEGCQTCIEVEVSLRFHGSRRTIGSSSLTQLQQMLACPSCRCGATPSTSVSAPSAMSSLSVSTTSTFRIPLVRSLVIYLTLGFIASRGCRRGGCIFLWRRSGKISSRVFLLLSGLMNI